MVSTFRVCRTLLLLALVAMSSATAQEPEFDLVIRGGQIVDGTGAPAFLGDLAVKADRIVAVGEISEGSGKIEIDAKGLVVAPGFIDIHSHSDRTLFTDGDAQSKIRQGVTTDILGEGSSGGPNTGRISAHQVTIHGEAVQIETLGDYFAAVEKATSSINIASYVGINNLWESVMGYAFDRPTAEQMGQMKVLLSQAMQQGALGLSTQVMTPPGSLATTDELVELAKVAQQHGGIYSSHIRNEGLGVFEAVEEAITVGRRAQIPVDIIHIKIADQKYWGRMSEIVAMIEAARRDGVQVHANVYPYTRGNNNLSSIIPPWAHEGGKQKLLERLQDPDTRKRMKKDIQEGLPGWYNHYTAVGGDWSRMLVAASNLYKGLTMDRVIAMKSEGQSPAPDPLDILFDLLIEQDGSVSTVYAHHTDEDMNLALLQPWCSVGSDGAALSITGALRQGNPHPRNFGTFPRVLGLYVREQQLLTLEDAIRKMTSLNAAKVGLPDRGILREDMAADITVFNPATVRDQSTYDDPFHYNVGIEHVIVNGRIVLHNGQHTGARPGKVLLRSGL